MLHILNGDAVAELIEQTNLPGDALAWREALVCGPTPRTDSLKKWIELRSRHLSHAYQQPLAECERTLREMTSKLDEAMSHDQIVLWFEFDLFCQVNLIYLLNRFSHEHRRSTDLFLVCLDSFSDIDNFRGLGQLSPAQLAHLFEERQEITEVDLERAAQGWAAYTSSDPTAIESYLQGEKSTTCLSFLEPALSAHLERFPSLRNGLGRVENRILELIAGGVDEMPPLFKMFGELDPIYGFGDWQFWNHLVRLANLRNPLLIISGLDPERAISDGRLNDAAFEVTDLGNAILNGEEDCVESNGIDLWLGGAHLSAGKTLWRWDEDRQRLVKS